MRLSGLLRVIIRSSTAHHAQSMAGAVGPDARSSEGHVDHALQRRDIEGLLQPMDVTTIHEVGPCRIQGGWLRREHDDRHIAQDASRSGGVDDLEPGLLVALRMEADVDDDEIGARADQLLEARQRTGELHALMAEALQDVTQQVGNVGVIVDDGGTGDGRNLRARTRSVAR
jgi:hypothetical protein